MKRIATLLLFTISSIVAWSQPKLSSYPSAKATIFLDFDGHTVAATPWNGGKTYFCAPSGLKDNQITEIFNRVSEDFRPFDINITTDSTVYLNAPLSNRIRVIITPTSDWYQGVGGVSFTRSFTWGDGTPAFVFPDRLSWGTKAIAECCSHEAGHTLGLSHQAKYNDNCNLITVYNEGIGSGQTGWAPIMGNSYGRNLSSWNNGPTPSGCTADQDNLSIITSINGFGYRPDDNNDNPRTGATLMAIDDDIFSTEGVISTNEDKDAFELNFSQPGDLLVSAKPFSVGMNNSGANLDVKMVILNSSFDTLAVIDPEDKLDADGQVSILPGKYFIVVQGTGNQNATNYGSLGSYTLSGNFRSMNAMPVSLLELKGNAFNNQHKLVWDLVCDEKINQQEIEISYNGKDFRNLAVVSQSTRHFIYNPLQQGELYYRIKVTTQTGSVTYSNIIILKNNANTVKINLKSNVVTENIEVQSDVNYQYILSDMNGKIIKRGNGTAGLNVISIANTPDGLYIIQIINNSQRITHRVVKL